LCIIETLNDPAPNFPFLLFTHDNGATWRKVALYGEQTTYGVFFLDELNGWVTGINGTLLHTTDGGLTWEHIATGAVQNLYDVAFTDPMNGWTVGLNGTILHTTDGGLTWSRENCESTVFFSKIAVVGSQTAYTVGGYATLLKYSPFGTSPCEDSPTAENNMNYQPNWSIIPNPATAHIAVTIDPNFPVEQEMIINIYTIWGQEVQQSRLNGYSTEMDVTSLPAGTYFVKIAGAGFYWPEKVFVKM
jgi:Secretion system C-terminal sorting domain/Photosynthesis system II assembly factor YCF48